MERIYDLGIVICMINQLSIKVPFFVFFVVFFFRCSHITPAEEFSRSAAELVISSYLLFISSKNTRTKIGPVVILP